VLAALHVAGYVPTDEKHIGYWLPNQAQPSKTAQIQVQSADQIQSAATGKLEPPKGLKASATTGVTFQPIDGGCPEPATVGEDAPPLPAIVPWEQFDSGDRHVLVLWLDQDQLAAGRHPMGSLALLRSRLQPVAGGKFVLIGPEDSTTLAAMALESKQGSSVDSPYRTRQSSNMSFPMYNFGATANESVLLKLVDPKSSSMADQLAHAGIQGYYRIVNEDRVLAESLACELSRRGVHLRLSLNQKQCPGLDTATEGNRRGHVVLISDWDTVYGNYLLKSVQEALDPEEQGRAQPRWITNISYLRGLDGRLPDRKYAGNGKSSKNNESEQGPKEPAAATPETTRDFEGAEGQSQFDYLGRLAEELKTRDTEFRRNGERAIAAVGVLGSDVYDKLLILQALRPEFPEALFFTTDLDALLLP